jgi:hypothetical protein
MHNESSRYIIDSNPSYLLKTRKTLPSLPPNSNFLSKTMTKEIIKDKNLVAYCGLYCGACKRFLADKCPGCQKNEKATWCKLRTCCIEHNFSSCADCKTFSDPTECKKFNNFFSKIFAFLFKSDRKACIQRIKEVGTDKFSEEMTEIKSHTIKKSEK